MSLFKAPPKLKVFKAPAPMKESAAENKTIYQGPSTNPTSNELGALKHEIQRRHMSMYANPGEKITSVTSTPPTDNYFTKLRNLLRVKYGGGKNY